MNAVSTLQQALQWAHELLEMVMVDVTPEQLAWQPPGIANPVGALYVHAVAGKISCLKGIQGPKDIHFKLTTARINCYLWRND